MNDHACDQCGSPVGSNSTCAACRKAYQRAYYRANKERLTAAMQENYQQNADARRAAQRQRYATNRARYSAQTAANAKRTPERTRAYKRAWAKRNPEAIRVKTLRRIARKRAAAGSYTAAQWRALCEHFGNVCLACGTGGPLTQDHVIPLDAGGPNTIDNLQPLCGRCNSSKGTRTIDYRDPRRLAAFLATQPP